MNRTELLNKVRELKTEAERAGENVIAGTLQVLYAACFAGDEEKLRRCLLLFAQTQCSRLEITNRQLEDL